MSAPAEVEVPDDPFVWLAIYSEAYVTADRALWRYKDGIDKGIADLNRTAEAHLENLREKRREAYSTLVASVMTCEAIRMGAKP